MKINILSNDLNRRLSNINTERMPEEEQLIVVEKFTQQLENSEYNRQECREIVVSGVKSWIRRHERRKKEGIGFYRSAASTLQGRIRKKLVDKTTWYQPRREDEEEDEVGIKPVVRKGMKKKSQEGAEPGRGTSQIKSVMFCPFTVRGELAKQLRQEEEIVERFTGYRVTVVEQVGDKILARLHTSNPWRGEHYGRGD